MNKSQGFLNVLYWMNINNIPAALWTRPCLSAPLAGESIPGWDHMWPAGHGYIGMVNGFIKHAISIFFLPSLCYLSSLGDLPGGLHLSFLNLSISSFLQSPFPRQHGLDGLFNGPAIDLLILERIRKKDWPWFWPTKQTGFIKIRFKEDPFRPSLRKSCMAAACGEFWRSHLGPLHMSSCFGSGRWKQKVKSLFSILQCI